MPENGIFGLRFIGQLLRRTVDGRRRPPRWLANYLVELSSGEAEVLAKKCHGVREASDRDRSRFSTADPVSPPRPPWPSTVRPIVVGAGPAGLFAALRLAEAGAGAVLLERGDGVEQRHGAVRDFWRHRNLNPDSNVVFGEGGAGAFSDGKIYTRIDHPLEVPILEEWIACGAPEAPSTLGLRRIPFLFLNAPQAR